MAKAIALNPEVPEGRVTRSASKKIQTSFLGSVQACLNELEEEKLNFDLEDAEDTLSAKGSLNDEFSSNLSDHSSKSSSRALGSHHILFGINQNLFDVDIGLSMEDAFGWSLKIASGPRSISTIGWSKDADHDRGSRWRGTDAGTNDDPLRSSSMWTRSTDAEHGTDADRTIERTDARTIQRPSGHDAAGRQDDAAGTYGLPRQRPNDAP